MYRGRFGSGRRRGRRGHVPACGRRRGGMAWVVGRRMRRRRCRRAVDDVTAARAGRGEQPGGRTPGARRLAWPRARAVRSHPTCVWRIPTMLVVALDERFGEPTDAYVNGSQVWLRDDGPGGMTIEWRLHPVAGYERPAGVDTYDVFSSVAFARRHRRVPVAPPASLWDGLEAFPAYGDESSRRRSPRSSPRSSASRPTRADSSTISSIGRRVGALPRRHLDRRAPARRTRLDVKQPGVWSDLRADSARRSLQSAESRPLAASVSRRAPHRRAGRVEEHVDGLAADRGERVAPQRSAPASGVGSASSANQPTSAHSSGWALSSPPSARQWNTSEYSGHAGEAQPQPSSTAMSRTTSTSMPVSSAHLLDRDLRRRVADVGPAGRVEPHAGVGPLHQQNLVLVVADDGADRDLRCDVPGDALADALRATPRPAPRPRARSRRPRGCRPRP